MIVALINSSPKAKESASGILSDDLKSCFPDDSEIVQLRMRTDCIAEETLEELQKADVWVFLCPLYVDGIPGHLLSCLAQLESIYLKGSSKRVYAVVNCGFYEGVQNEIALKILQNWCAKTGFVWGGGVGVGAGGCIGSLSKTDPQKGPKAPIFSALKSLASNIVNSKAQENNYVSVGMPRFLYRTAAQLGWRITIRSNGGKIKDLSNRP